LDPTHQIRDCAHEYVGISGLTDDYLNTTGVINKIPDCEGMAMIRRPNGTYFLITSHKTGWSPNPLIAWRSTTTDLATANWTNLGNPTNNETSFNSQPTYVVQYTPHSGSPYYVYMVSLALSVKLRTASCLQIHAFLPHHANTNLGR
jgi:hypothetical protein